MRNLYKKIPLVLLSALTFPILADKKKAEKEETRDEPTYHHKLVLSYEIGQKEKGKGQIKGQMPISEGNTVKYTINLGGMPTGKIWEETGHASGDGAKGYLNKFEPSMEDILKWTKGLAKEWYTEYEDATGKQSMQWGIISSHYNKSQVVGVQFKTPDVDIIFDFEGFLRMFIKHFFQWNHLSYFKGQAHGADQHAFEKSKSGLAAMTLKWVFEAEDELTIGVELAKGDYKKLKVAGGFDIGQYIASFKTSYKFKEPAFDLIHEIEAKYTRFTDKKKGEELVVTPSISVSIDFGKIVVFEEKATISVDGSYCFCDMKNKYTEKNGADAAPYHFALEVSLKFKNPFDHDGLTVTPKCGLQYTNQDHVATWGMTASDYGKFSSSASVSFKLEKQIGEEYYVL